MSCARGAAGFTSLSISKTKSRDRYEDKVVIMIIDKNWVSPFKNPNRAIA